MDVEASEKGPRIRRVGDATRERFAADVGVDRTVSIAGSRTRWHHGGDLEEAARVLRAPSGVISHTPSEMTVHVRAGTLVSELHAALAEHGQRTALPERGGTVGGAVAIGDDHVCALGRGSLRASVLEVSYVSAEGRIVVGGGPTVKNVSGYDLPRLMVGSIGTLGLFADVILRTQPVPELSAWFASADVHPSRVRSALWRPGAILWDGVTVWVLLEGVAADVAAASVQLRCLAPFEAVEAGPPLPNHRWSVRVRRLIDLEHDPLDSGPFLASVGTGTLFATRPQPARSLAAPLVDLHQRIKHNFDPCGRLNPGRSPLNTYVRPSTPTGETHDDRS